MAWEGENVRVTSLGKVLGAILLLYLNCPHGLSIHVIFHDQATDQLQIETQQHGDIRICELADCAQPLIAFRIAESDTVLCILDNIATGAH